MGTSLEWFRVLIAGGIWAIFTAFTVFAGPLLLVQPRKLHFWMRCAFIALSGLGFGIVDTFGGRAFRSPLVFLTLAVLGVVLILAVSFRRLIRNEPRVPFISRESPLFGGRGQKQHVRPLG